MKIYRNLKLIRALALSAGGLTSLATSASASSFVYTTGDLVLAFRQSGAPDLVVDIGPAANYDAVAAGSTITINNLPTGLPALLNGNYSSLDGLNWSVTGSERLIGAAFPFQTVWASASRLVVNVQTTPWTRQDQFAQGNPAGQIAAIGNNAATYSSAHPAGANNNATAIVIPNNDPNAYTPLVEDPFNSTESDLGGTFQGNVENSTPFDFDSDEPLSISDLYELQPVPQHSSGLGKWIGYFSFTSDGNVTFTAATVAPPVPTITAVQRNGNVTSVSFTTAANFNYSLIATNTVGIAAPKSTWPATGASITGTGAVLTLQDTNSSAASFYAITAH